MFQSFSGSSRRPRQVNLSGRHSVASPSTSRQPSVPTGPQTTLATAQQERLHRQQDRDRLNAARLIQRRWRGYSSRKTTRAGWRRQWDQLDKADGTSAFSTEGDCLLQLGLLVQVFDTTAQDDFQRLDSFSARLLVTAREKRIDFTQDRWRFPLSRLGKLSLAALSSNTISSPSVKTPLSVLLFLTTTSPGGVAGIFRQYYHALSSVLRRDILRSAPESEQRQMMSCVLAPLQTSGSDARHAYEGFATAFLTSPDLQSRLGQLEQLSSLINTKLLATTMATVLSRTSSVQGSDSEGRLWQLAQFMCLHQAAHPSSALSESAPEPDYIAAVSILLCSLADEIGRRIDLDDVYMAASADGDEEEDEDDNANGLRQRPVQLPLPPFVRQQILSLVNQRSITGLLTHTDPLGLDGQSGQSLQATSEARLLASYALSLLRIFPRRADEIRMWLYLGSTSRPMPSAQPSSQRLPAIKYFWNAARHTKVFGSISGDSRAAVDLLKRKRQSARSADRLAEESGEDWRILLIFFELYSFVLKVMDDEEFFSPNPAIVLAEQSVSSWTRESALPLDEVKDLTTFLKNLAFTMYWNAAEISGEDGSANFDGFQSYFGSAAPSRAVVDQSAAQDAVNNSIAGVTGMTIDHVKGIVTGLLRMVYERDSRRRFLPKDHWLMTGRFDMQGFIPDVVAEEENRHRVQEADEEDEEDEEVDERSQELGHLRSSAIIGTQHVQRTRAIEALKRRQRKASRKKYLEAVTPRLKILQNMPFFIPFATRVQIFRAFVLLDQRRRRGGHIDPDHWRMAVMQSSMFPPTGEDQRRGNDVISKHHAKIRRESVFEDAYEQFYELGDGLKEPIQITFVDRFDTVEAGIDGGGVTKEFLMSVTNEAFGASTGLSLFVENDQNLLYPNPAAVDERRDFLRQAGLSEGSPEWNEQIRDLLRRYEFLGRVIGKCLYEGILVDVGFAGFFLLKWALTGGIGSASKESGYRANLNDLRDLDEGLYQGLVWPLRSMRCEHAPTR